MNKMATKQAKRKVSDDKISKTKALGGVDLFVDAPPDENSSGEDDSDTTDSEESVYSGLEEEESSSEDESVESFEEGESSEEDIENDKGKSTETQKQGKTQKQKKTPHIQPDTKSTMPSTSAANQPGTDAPDEYDFDSSDEEDIRNTVGNIPMEWYKEFEHLGYDWDGKKVLKPKEGDELDEFLNKMENPDYWRTVKDKTTGQRVVLADSDVEIIQRLKQGKFADASYDPYEPWTDFFTHEKMIHPLSNTPAHKRSFIPSLLEKKKVGKLVHAIKMGWIKPRKEKKPEDDEPKYYGLWENDDDQAEITKRHRMHIPAPKMPLPGHAESYNPPPEYLFTEEEELAWKEKDPEERKINFIPQKYSSLRQLPAYPKFINERFERCLDLYLCPRQRKMRMNVDPEDLIPKLPKPKDLQPFPTTQAIIYKGHQSLVRSISVDPSGQWLVSGSDDKTIKLWEVSTGRCMRTITMDGVIKCVAWNPNPAISLIAVAIDQTVLIFNPLLGDKLITSNTDEMLSSFTIPEEDAQQKKLPVDWQVFEGRQYDEGLRVKVTHQKAVSRVTWHGRGDYFAVTLPEGDSDSVLIHQLSKRRTQKPFKKRKGLVQCVLFHPTRPFLFLATQTHVRVYNLLKQMLMKKLLTNCKWVSSMAVHPGGDNIIVGSYDCKLGWFDLDLSSKPYQTLRHHKKAIRQVCYHPRYPVFASASDDGTIIVCHGMVYNDLMQNPLIVPVKVLRGHAPTKGLGVLDCTFHPTQPWLFSSGSDSTIRLFT